ncbi:unknown protein [Microcystis aeruginosa NIES-843]|uniref:Transposase n=1 Tax=Microcystis aeruginosa (strain NIES-843 / IAM M-2473) TaxID=449447 RepID=B0JIA8_MICAN|nr:unknown protein [Microcystis aeruginosa NIES-843]
MSDAPLIKGGLKGGLRGDRHPPYQRGQGGSNLKSIFNLIITSYLISERIELKTFKTTLLVSNRSPAPDGSLLG